MKNSKSWDDYKQQMDEVLLPRGTGQKTGLTLTKGMTKQEMFEALKKLQEDVRNRFTSPGD